VPPARGLAVALLAACGLAGCGGERWPEPAAVDPAAYEAQHQAWLEEQQGLLGHVLPLVGVWPLDEGEAAFGADAALPIVLAGVPAKAGVFRRSGTTITIDPAPGSPLRMGDVPVVKPTDVTDDLTLGTIRLSVVDAGDDRRWVTALDESHPSLTSAPEVERYPLDARWRVPARFDAFDMPTPVVVPDVRGGSMSFLALGQLVFRLDGREHRLTALGEPGGGQFFVMFKDRTNETTTYSGYRILTPEVVGDDEWTVVDFNFAFNPPCAYSRFTLCPLPPPENRLPVAVEAGLKRLPSAQGYSGS
jgi:uncharacterized protein (DUF1684 family)